MSDPSAHQKFLDVFPALRDELLEHFSGEGMPEIAHEWYKKNLDYNVTDGKLIRGISVINTVEMIRCKQLDGEEYKRVAVLGWCLELMQAFILVADDIMDRSVERRNKPCYYCLPGVGNFAVNDAFMLESAVFQLLKSYYRTEPYYVDILELFHEAIYFTEMGQLVDVIVGPPPQTEASVDETSSRLSLFSIDIHRIISFYKTGFYTFYTPIALGMHFCGLTAPVVFTFAKKILLPMGEYYQVQDDYLDWGGTREELGKKVGMDIIDGKCSWLVAKALLLATPEQRATLNECYGRKDSVKEARVKALYEDLGLHTVYKDYERDICNKLDSLINMIPEDGLGVDGGVKVKQDVFRSILGMIYKRRK